MKRILIVDDNLDIVLMFRSAIAQLGHEVQVASSGEDALRMAEARPYDLVMTDLSMPGMDGLEFMEALRLRGDRCALVVITAFPKMTDAHMFAKLGVFRCLIKPVHVADLEEAAQAALAWQPG